jgi:hypothetical protein
MAMLDDTTDYSGHLIAAKQVRGTTVYNTALEEVGFVEDLLIDHATGRIVYAVLKSGSHFRVGGHYSSLLWERFSYNAELGGYIVDTGSITG